MLVQSPLSSPLRLQNLQIRPSNAVKANQPSQVVSQNAALWPLAPASLYFGSKSSDAKRRARRAIQQLEAMQTRPKLDKRDQNTLNSFGKLFGDIKVAEVEVGKQAIDVLSVEALNKLDKGERQEILDGLTRSLQARLGATDYNPPSVKVGNRFYVAHNTLVPLKPSYSSEDIQKTLESLEKKSVFRVHTNPQTGLIQTSETANQLMLRQWFTDSCMVGMLQRDKDPKNWQKAMLVSAAALNTKAATEAVDKSVVDPNWFRTGGVMDGVFHIYQPESVHFDPKTQTPVVENIRLDDTWFNQKRLESQALVLSNLVDTTLAGLVPDKTGRTKAWGFSPAFLASPERSKLITNAMVNMARYLMAVNTNPKTKAFDFAAPSASSWEETPFEGGMTSDTGMTVLAFEKLHDLMFNSQYDGNPSIQAVRQTILQAPNAETLSNKKILEQFIQQGRQKVAERITEPLNTGKEPMQNPARKPDTSVLLLAASDYRFHPDNLMKDAKTRLKMVQAMQPLSGEYGMRRYNEFELHGEKLHDSYLNTNYHMLTALREALAGAGQKSKMDYGSTDASSVEAMKERQALSRPETAAQWCLGISASLQALARAKLDLLHYMHDHKQLSSPDELQLLQSINTELHDFTTRNLALISGPLPGHAPVIRADGTPCPENSVMEAYEVVTDLRGGKKWVPGAHTLPWGSAQLYDGLKRALAAHKLEELLLSSKTQK